jgi:hypothetical protein
VSKPAPSLVAQAPAKPAPVNVVVPSPPVMPPSPDPVVAVARVEPARPRAGDTLTVRLKATGLGEGALVFQYRFGPKAEWQTAPGGVVQLPGLKPGPLTLELRVVDGRGRTSPVLTQTWKVERVTDVVLGRSRWKEGDRFFQEVVVSRKSRFGILGIVVPHQAQYAFLSSFEVVKISAEGLVVVRQKVEGVRLDNAEAGLQAQLNGLLQKAKGATFQITVGPGGEVLKLEGAPQPIQVLAGDTALGGTAFLIQSLLDADGWKELAQLTFFQPPGPPRPGQQWTRKTTHSWGPLGGWLGQVGYAYAGRQAAVDRYDYVLGLTYVPPPKGAGGLPFQVTKAAFRLQAGGGSIAYDPSRGWVSAAEERFQVQGLLGVAALGAASEVEMEEAQLFRLRILDRNPWQ